jgi:CDP-glycerol glycerophosphotransferase
MLDPNPGANSPAAGTRAPMLSLIIPVYNIQEYIAPCLDAIASQSFEDVEIIVVDGGSRDETLDRLEKWNIDQPRLRIQAETEPGPGRARNRGASAATGEYVWFIDGDDLIAPGSLMLIADRLRTTQADVLLINHEVVHPGEARRTASQDDQLLARSLHDTFTIADQPSLLGLRLVSWNKIIRREFLARTGTKFLERFPHEDVPVSCDLLLAADRLSVLAEVCYHQLDRPGSIMNAGEQRRHFTIFEAWRPILTRASQDARTGERHVTPRVYHALFERAIWHCSTVFDTGGYGLGRFGADGFIARRDRREFFTAMHKLYVEFMPDGYQLPPGLRGVKFSLIAQGRYAAYAILDPPNQLRMTIDRRRQQRLSRTGVPG